MLTKHRKVATFDDTASTADVKTDDWNDVHCFDLGSLVPVGVLVLSFDPSGFVLSSGRGGVAGATRVDVGVYSADVTPLPSAAIADGCVAEYFAVPSMAPMPTALAAMVISPSIVGSTLEVSITDGSFAAVDPTVTVKLYFTVWVSIAAEAPAAP
ncbi:hypothetical protein [Quatrionicoccus australiensis]|uniref:hypothetical protein n=1 Tax=Quatrionicoccus australiensis TaxID=138118 RepID=UPI001CF8487B|nr:hypothetical protein [Quatrionicoccus australiensis]UCV13761.1 hypothetical protein KI612_12430 [Quatrionicoccus australiensis]